MSKYSKLIILVQLDLQIIEQKYTFFVNVSSYYTNINDGKINLIEYYSAFRNTLNYSNKDKILSLFTNLINYKDQLNEYLDKYYLVFISNYEDIDLFKSMSEIYNLSDSDINLLIRMFNYVKGFFTSSLFKNIYQISSEYKEYRNNNTIYKLYKLINYPDPNLNINNDTLMDSIKHYIETILITSNLTSVRFNDINYANITYSIGNPLN